MVVGADGTNSKVRHLLLGDERAAAIPASTPENPFFFTNSTVQYPKAEQAKFLRQLHPTFYMALHPEGGVFWVSRMYAFRLSSVPAYADTHQRKTSRIRTIH